VDVHALSRAADVSREQYAARVGTFDATTRSATWRVCKSNPHLASRCFDLGLLWAVSVSKTSAHQTRTTKSMLLAKRTSHVEHPVTLH